jgi:hypothetical protein
MIMVRELIGPHFITTSPSPTICKKCNAQVLAATVGGLDYRVDVVPLTVAGELEVLIRGGYTFELRNELLIRRTVQHIGAGLPDHAPVLAAHSCRPVADEHINHLHLEVASALVRLLLGGTPVPAEEQVPF